MRKVFLILSAAAMPGIAAVAQSSSVYATVGASYGLPLMTQTTTGVGGFISGNGSSTTWSTSSVTTQNLKKVSFGQGAYLSLGLGYCLGKNWALELDAQLGIASPEYQYTEQSVSSGSDKDITTYTQKMENMILFNPALRYSIPGHKADFYGKVGLVVPAYARTEWRVADSYVDGNGNGNSVYAEYDMHHRFALGFSAALGMKYHLSRKCHLFAEANAIALSMYTRKMVCKRYLYNTSDLTAQLPDYVRVVRYGFGYDSSAGNDPEDIATSVSMSRLDLKFGFEFGL